MATAPKSPNWTAAHESALTGLLGLGLGKKHARSLLEPLPPSDLASMMRAALRSHTQAKKPAPVEGGPQGAAPIMGKPAPPPAAPAAAQTKPAPSMLRSFVPPRAPLQAAAVASGAAPQPQPKISLRGFTPAQKPPSPKAEEPEGKPPFTQIIGAPPGWKPSDVLVKPRIRVRAAGQKLPAAPLGTETPSSEATSPTEAPQVPTEGKQTPSKKKPLVFISTQREYDGLEPGTEFVWPNGRVYEKPAAES